MKDLIILITNNKEWFFSGIGVFILSGIIIIFRKSIFPSKNREQAVSQKITSNNSSNTTAINASNTTVNVNVNHNGQNLNTTDQAKKDFDIKLIRNILQVFNKRKWNEFFNYVYPNGFSDEEEVALHEIVKIKNMDRFYNSFIQATFIEYGTTLEKFCGFLTEAFRKKDDDIRREFNNPGYKTKNRFDKFNDVVEGHKIADENRQKLYYHFKLIEKTYDDFYKSVHENYPEALV